MSSDFIPVSAFAFLPSASIADRKRADPLGQLSNATVAAIVAGAALTWAVSQEQHKSSIFRNVQHRPSPAPVHFAGFSDLAPMCECEK